MSAVETALAAGEPIIVVTQLDPETADPGMPLSFMGALATAVGQASINFVNALHVAESRGVLTVVSSAAVTGVSGGEEAGGLDA